MPDPEQIRTSVREIICDVLKRKKSKFTLEDVQEGVSLTKDLGIDSLDVLQMTATAEKLFKLKIPEAESQNLDELGGIVRTVAKYWPRD